MANKISEVFILLGIATIVTSVVMRPNSAKIISATFHGFSESMLAAEGNAAGFKK